MSISLEAQRPSRMASVSQTLALAQGFCVPGSISLANSTVGRYIETRMAAIEPTRLTAGELELAFEDEQLRAMCTTRGRALAVHGPEIAQELKKRLADIRAAETASDLLVGIRFVGDGECAAIWVTLGGGFELVLVANHVQNPTKGSGKIDWDNVTRVKVSQISRMATE